MIADTLAERRATLTARLGTLRNERTTAVTACRPFDYAKVAAAEAELEALADAEAAAVQRDRDAAEAKRLTDRRNTIAELHQMERDRLAHIARADTAARDLVKALADAERTSREMLVAFGRINERTGPLSTLEMNMRLSQRLAMVLSLLPGHPARYGSLSWRQNAFSPHTNWSDAERALAAPILEHLKG